MKSVLRPLIALLFYYSCSHQRGHKESVILPTYQDSIHGYNAIFLSSGFDSNQVIVYIDNELVYNARPKTDERDEVAARIPYLRGSAIYHKIGINVLINNTDTISREIIEQCSNTSTLITRNDTNIEIESYNKCLTFE
ncbi:MAG TPA: hypothetical protein VG603_01490 [Chitinophagales bacterium]|nr:hypothetical protein [Chitinophagales bacterium]